MAKDLFDESTMTFGEHLEVLRVHLWRAIIGLVIATVFSFFISREVLWWIQAPVTRAMEKFFNATPEDAEETGKYTPWETVQGYFGGTTPKAVPSEETDPEEIDPTETAPRKTDPNKLQAEAPASDPLPAAPKDKPPAKSDAILAQSPAPTLELTLDAVALARKLHEAFPKEYPALPKDAPRVVITVPLTEKSQTDLQTFINAQNAQVRTDSVDEAFMIYLKVSLVCGVMIASPYIFWEIWQFVAAGLFPHERKYVYTYLPLSLGLFLGGAALCFFAVIPIVLDFLFGFNAWLGLRPEMKISSWLTFVIILPLMFGISFQLPMVMVFLEKIGLLSVPVYRQYRRHAIFVIAILSMILTPSDPVSMLMMMIPLLVLYELGILLCSRRPSVKSPFQTQPA